MFAGEHRRAEPMQGKPVLEAQPSVICIFLVNVKVVFYKTMHKKKKGRAICTGGVSGWV